MYLSMKCDSQYKWNYTRNRKFPQGKSHSTHHFSTGSFTLEQGQASLVFGGKKAWVCRDAFIPLQRAILCYAPCTTAYQKVATPELIRW